ncbi:hypothetical protein M408DRAFT_169884 [Serendipita vermifera MAFF 305830]|uniref:ParB/Sulfiredoxin domain-containing protein n=1 Tax=Serendipita vermifera MAFF 305830 TaxID=933852 RepID=A0A0C2WMC4_SERVB|nr:hypothetical protein M408DRAFT_169884 [Serendipita vermifera MAFF 305830]
MDQTSVHIRLLQARVGIANIGLDSIKLHDDHRLPTGNHVEALKGELYKSAHTRWTYPIDLVACGNVPESWLETLADARLIDEPYHDGQFICISGQHRVLAAKQLAEGYPPVAWQTCYPATVYNSEVLADEELQLWMAERNISRPSLPLTIHQRFRVVDRIETEAAQNKAFNLLGWKKGQAKSLGSIRQSNLWPLVLKLLDTSLYQTLSADAIISWGVHYYDYPFLVFLFEDLLEQQDLLANLERRGRDSMTMEYFFGDSFAHNNYAEKSGDYRTLAARFNVIDSSLREDFSHMGFQAFWDKVTRRTTASRRQKIGDTFLFGKMIPTIYDLKFHNWPSQFSDLVYRVEVAASLLHLRLYYPQTKTFPIRRPKHFDKQVDWTMLIDPESSERAIQVEGAFCGRGVY